MNTSLTAYTHLESLLLFQSLSFYGIGTHAFSKISDLLKSTPSITNDKKYQAGRLSPDALRNFYLALLTEELKSEQQNGQRDGEGQNGDFKNPKKRKASTPTLPTVQEAAQHQHLIPKLIEKLYVRYRTSITHEIRDDEDRYERLQRELQSLERGDRDQDLLEKINGKASASRSPSLSKKSPLVQQRALPQSPRPQIAIQDEIKVATPPVNPLGGPSNAATDALRSPGVNGQTRMDHVARNVPHDTSSKPGVPPHPQSLPGTPLGPGHAISQQSRSPHPVTAPPPPTFSQSQVPNTGYAVPSSNQHRSPYPPPAHQSPAQIHRGAPPQGSPHVPNQIHIPHPQTSAAIPSPTRNQVQSPHVPTYGGNGTPQYGSVPPAHQQLPPSARNPGQNPPTAFAPGPQSPGIQTPQQQRNYYPYPGQPQYAPPQAGQRPPQGGFMLPTFQVSPQDPNRAHQRPASQHAQVSTPVGRQFPQPPKPVASPGSTQYPSPFPPHVYPPRDSFSTPTNLRTPLSAASTPRSAKTVWKSSVHHSSNAPLPPRPQVSPIDDILPQESPKQAQSKPKASRKPRSKPKPKETEKEADHKPEVETKPDVEEPITQSEEQAPEVEPRQGRSRRKAAPKRARPGSVASSQAGASVRERSRSQSIISHTETVAADNESQTGTHVKSERGASIDVIEEDPMETPTQPTTRRRGGNVQALQTRGRKRTAREASLPESEDRHGSPELPKVVVAPRHFSRMCNPIMNDIGSHKHASLFSTAVRAKDAEGYHEIIKRPTDLKTIQKAIAVGAKTVAAAATDTPTGSPGGGGGIVELPISSDVTPPKAIVNSAQLEKELMRMFVNAVMFNAGEEGVVEDARQMFEDCQQKISNWRNAERSTGRMEAEDTPPVFEEKEEIPTTSKRRKG